MGRITNILWRLLSNFWRNELRPPEYRERPEAAGGAVVGSNDATALRDCTRAYNKNDVAISSKRYSSN